MQKEFEKWRAIRASVGGVGDVQAWVLWVECLRGWHASVGDVGGVLTWLHVIIIVIVIIEILP